jgi:hypothetical protein
MQHGRSEAGFPRTSAFLGLRSHKSFLPAQVTLGCAPRPLPTPPPRVRPRYQHIPVAARTKHTGAGQPRRGRRSGSGDVSGSGPRWTGPGRKERREEAGKALPARQASRRTPGGRDRGRDWRGGRGWARARRGRGKVRLTARRPDEAKAAPSPSPPPPPGL